jgi:hypothetical protein
VELVVVRSGDVMTIYPAKTSIPEMIERLRALPMPPAIEQRDEEELPEREGLWSVAFLLDTKVAIHLRDGDRVVTDKVAALDGAVLM